MSCSQTQTTDPRMPGHAQQYTDIRVIMERRLARRDYSFGTGN